MDFVKYKAATAEGQEQQFWSEVLDKAEAEASVDSYWPPEEGEVTAVNPQNVEIDWRQGFGGVEAQIRDPQTGKVVAAEK